MEKLKVKKALVAQFRCKNSIDALLNHMYTL